MYFHVYYSNKPNKLSFIIFLHFTDNEIRLRDVTRQANDYDTATKEINDSNSIVFFYHLSSLQ